MRIISLTLFFLTSNVSACEGDALCISCPSISAMRAQSIFAVKSDKYVLLRKVALLQGCAGNDFAPQAIAMAAELGSALDAEQYASYLEDKGRYKEALKWYEVAADRGDKYATLTLARIFMSGEHKIEKNRIRALKLLERIAWQGSPNDMANFANALIQSDPSETEKAKAVSWFRAATKFGSNRTSSSDRSLFTKVENTLTDDGRQAAEIFYLDIEASLEGVAKSRGF